MSQAPAMPLFIDALIGDTTHLSAEEFGAYLLILCKTWSNNGTPLPDDDRRMARVCRVTPGYWRKHLRPVLAPFFDLSGQDFRQKRLEKEWIFVASQSQKNRDSANARWLKNKKTGDANGYARTMPERCQTDAPTPTPIYKKYNLREEELPRASDGPPWEQRCAAWAKSGFWNPFWGPKPDQPDCHAPADLVAAALAAKRDAA